MTSTTDHPNYGTLPRQQLTFAACDALARSGRKPSVALVREQTMLFAGIKKGSDGDVQEDIRLWYDALFALKRDAAIGGVPEQMATLFRATWRGAVELAEEGLAAERATLKREREQAAADVDRAGAAADALRHQLALAQAELDARDGAIARLDGTVAQCRAELVQLNAKLGAKDERIAGLTDELARKTTEQAAAVTELDGARRHALLQVDQARGEGRHWKEQFERADQDARGARTAADTYRGKASNLEAELAGTKGRLQAMQETQVAEKARLIALEAQLQTEQATARRNLDEVASARVGAQAAHARMESAARELDAVRELAEQLRTGERRALEELMQLRAALTPSASNAIPGRQRDNPNETHACFKSNETINSQF